MMPVAQAFITILLLTNQLRFEVASTPEERRLGLMYRQVWGNTSGMFFIHEHPGPVSYWMKNTYLDMRILYLDPDLNLRQVNTPETMSLTPLPSSNTNIRYVLEIKPSFLPLVLSNYGTFRRELIRELRRTNLYP